MNSPFASLPQYDLPELTGATDAWWVGIAGHLRRQGVADVPDTLTRASDGEALWRDPALLLTQTCGYPLMTELRDYLQPVATPDYDCEGCAPGHYSSAIIVRRADSVTSLSDLRGRRAAVNNANSHSGMNALRHTVAPLAPAGTFFGSIVLSGGHALSAEAVRRGEADVAAIDSVTWALLHRYRSQAVEELRVLQWTRQAPALPYAVRVDAQADLVRRIRDALLDAAKDPDLATCRGDLLIKAMRPAGVEDYAPMLAMKAEAERLGYPQVA
ncbi:phosphate/phosphite/phosphonate ABC transporter substrate-binding protein [Pacificispira sp.]|uniref:phosphate/phosphite/phosphonate ABC transporter substrate-binding protein n=1 Tax=Pacificispira sp. TaxID=2888761 RepID=UPI003BAB30D8